MGYFMVVFGMSFENGLILEKFTEMIYL